MKIEVTNSDTSIHRRRALGYLRWYPAKWRARYGEEFVAHLEDEIEEQPVSYVRGLNIALHGVTARFRLDRSLRWTTSVVLIVAMVGALIVGVLAYEARSVEVPLSLSSSGAAGVPTSPKTINNFNFNFSNRSSLGIRLLHVSLISFRGYPLPRVARVEIDVSHQAKFNLTLPQSSPGLVPAFGHSVMMRKGDTLVVGMVAPQVGRLYAVGGLRLQYERKGVVHAETVSTMKSPDLLCGESRPSATVESAFCSHGFTTAWALSNFYYQKTPHQTPAQSEALITANAAFSYVTSQDLRTPSLSEVNSWATRLFAHRGSWRIAGVNTTMVSKSQQIVKNELLFHFNLVNRATNARTIVCVRNGAYFHSGGMTGPALAAC
ncbi:MAG: hypothetical protein HIU84_06990 [Acidobacteria bacterium]|nr:hypothetical protein [Acidobacteriota bacterium]